MKIIYAGSPDASKITLEILYNNQAEYGFEIVGVLSNPDSAKGRHKELTPTPVAAFAMEKGLPVFKPEHLDAVAREEVQALNPDLLVSFAYGHIFGPKFLGIFPMGGINLHPSLLPKYRGCTPVPAAIKNRDKQTAATVQTLALKMDEGDIVAQQIIDLDGTETGESLLNNSAEIGARLILELLKDASENGKLKQGVSQTGESSYTNTLTKDDGRIDWTLSAAEIEAQIRAYNPNPGCWTMENQLPLKIIVASFIDDNKYSKEKPGTVVEFNKGQGIFIQTGKGILAVLELQRQGKKNMKYKDFMNGARDFVGTILE